MPAVVGVDLAGSPNRATGICKLEGDKIVSCTVVHADEEIISYVQKERPALVAVDAPLSRPYGRKSMEDRNGKHFRPCDRELLRRHIPFFPITLGPMRSLTERGIRLKNRLETESFRVVEIYPGGAQDVWGLPRAKRDRAGLRRGLARLGLRGIEARASDHELDAVTGALVGRFFLLGKARLLGDFSTGAIVMPAESSGPRRAGQRRKR